MYTTDKLYVYTILYTVHQGQLRYRTRENVIAKSREDALAKWETHHAHHEVSHPRFLWDAVCEVDY